jgi:hypothetical protein
MDSLKIGRPLSSEYAPHARGYVDLVKGDDLIHLLSEQLKETVALVEPLGDDYASIFRYEPGKWTVKEIIGHLSDCERIFAYRMLRLGRQDTTPLPPFEQNGYVAAAGSNHSPLHNLLQEFKAVRTSTLWLLRGLPSEAWARSGRVSDWTVTVRGIAFTAAGHELHHRKILRERYLPRR